MQQPVYQASRIMRTSLHHIQAKERRRSSMGVQLVFIMVEAQSN
jgi:hypothetical protein